MKKALVVCIGNDLVGDDGAGQAVFKRLIGADFPPQVRLLHLGLGGINLVEKLEGEELLIVVDAVQLGTTPGRVHVLAWDELPISECRPVSGHGIGVREAIEVARKLYPSICPNQIYLVGIEGQLFDQLGARLSSQVEEGVEEAVSVVAGLLRDTLGSTSDF